MKDAEAIQMMRRASEEIRQLRHQIEVLAPKAHAYDTLSSVLQLLPKPSQGFGEDFAWRLDKRIQELEAQNAPAVEETQA